MDNLRYLKGERVKQLIEERLPANLPTALLKPDFNPIEQAFSKLKSRFREACARSQQTLIELIGELDNTSSENASLPICYEVVICV
jgi:transposase